MGLKYYLRLIKNENDCETVKLKYFVNMFVTIVCFLCFILFFALRGQNLIVSAVFGIIAIDAAVISNYLGIKFNKYIRNLIESEPLTENDPVDAAFARYRSGYLDAAKPSAADRIYMIISIVISVGFIAVLPVCIVLSVTGNPYLAEQIYFYVLMSGAGYLLIALLYGVMSAIKGKGAWYQKFTADADTINEYKASLHPGRGWQKYRLTADKKQSDQIKYFFDDAVAGRRYKKQKHINAVINMIFGILMVAAGIAVPNLIFSDSIPENYGGLTALIIFGILGLWLAVAIPLYYIEAGILKREHKRLKADFEKHESRLFIIEARKAFYRRWNITMALILFGAIISNIIFMSLTAWLLGDDNPIGLWFILLFFVEIIMMFVVYFKSYGRYRTKIIEKENLIDKQSNTANDIEAMKKLF